MNLYWKHPEQEENCERFRALMDDYPHLKFFHPNESAAPWHIQVKVKAPGQPYERMVNFWPHVAKMQAEDERTIQGWEYIGSAFEKVCAGENSEDVVLLE